MADCKEIDAALAKLSGKIDGLNGRLNDLESKQKQCCEKKGNNSNPKDDDLTELIKRIQEIEKIQEALKIGIVETLNNFAQIESVNKDFASAFAGLYELINPMLESVSSIIEFIKI